MPEQFRKINLNDIPKLLFEGSMFGLSRYFFTLAIKTGAQMQAFALMPEDAKELHKVLGNTINIYEKQYGPIPELNGAIESPMHLLPPHDGK